MSAEPVNHGVRRWLVSRPRDRTDDGRPHFVVCGSDALAAPAFVAAALGEVAPTHFRYAGRTLHVARRGDVPASSVVLALTAANGSGQLRVLPADPEPGAAGPADLVFAAAMPGRVAGPARPGHPTVRTDPPRRRRRVTPPRCRARPARPAC